MNDVLIYFFQLVATFLFILLILRILGNPQGKIKTNNAQARDGFMDFLKGSAIFGVVLLHTTFGNFNEFISMLFGIAIPVFIFVSGYLLATRYTKKLDISQYLKKMFFRVVLVYLIFIFLGYLFVPIESISLQNIALDIILGRHATFYFIPVLIQLYLLFPFLIKNEEAFTSKTGLFLVLTVSSFFQLVNNYLTNIGENNLNLQMSMAFCGSSLFYFVLGMLLAKYRFNRIDLKKCILIIVAYFLFVLVLYPVKETFSIGGFNNVCYLIFVIFLAWGVYSPFKKVAPGLFHVFEKLGKESYAIYLLHTTRIVSVLTQVTFLLFFGYQTESYAGISLQIAFMLLTLTFSYVLGSFFMGIYRAALRYLGLEISFLSVK